MIEINEKILADVIKVHRKKSGLNQKELADLAGVGKNVVYYIEKGKATIQLDTLLKVLNVLNIRLMAAGPFVPDEKGDNNAQG